MTDLSAHHSKRRCHLRGVGDSEDPEMAEDAAREFARLHGETALALQIALATGEFREGRYVRSRYGADWRLAEGG